MPRLGADRWAEGAGGGRWTVYGQVHILIALNPAILESLFVVRGEIENAFTMLID